MILSDSNFYFFKGENTTSIKNQVVFNGLYQMYDNVVKYNITI